METKWLTSDEQMLQEADSLIADDTFDADDRATISAFYNGRPTMTPSEAADRGIAEITNHLFGYDSLNMAREQITAIYSKSPTLIKVDVKGGEPADRMFRTEMVTKYLNRAIKRSGRFKPQFKGLGGDVVLFGASFFTFRDPYDWCPRMTRPYVPRGTGITPEDVPYAVIPDYLTVKELTAYLRMAEGEERGGGDARWHIKNLKMAIRELTGNLGLDRNTREDNLAETPADIEEYDEQEGMDESEHARVQLPVYFVYTSNPDKKGCPFDMTVLARYSAKQKEDAKKRDVKLRARLFSHEEYFPSARDFLHTFFLDCNIGGPAQWHRTMGLGRLNYDNDVDVEEFFNAAMQGSKENLRRLYTSVNAASTETAERWLSGELHSNLLPEGLQIAEVPKTSNFEGAFTTMSMLQQLSQKNAAGSITNVTGAKNKTNELEVQALERQGRNATAISNRMNDIYEDLDNLGQVQFKRFCNPSILPVDSGYDEIIYFQNKMEELGISLDMLREEKDGELVNVDVKYNRVSGDGDRVRETMVNQMLLSRLHLYPPQSQKIILRRVTALETQDFELAEELVPTMDVPDGNQVNRANNEANTAFLQGKTPLINEDDLDMIHVPEHLASLQGLVQKGQQAGWTPWDIVGFRALGGHTVAHIDRIKQNPDAKDVARHFEAQLQEIAKMGDELANAVQQEEEAKQQQPMTEKERAEMALKQGKLQLDYRAQEALEQSRQESQDFRERQQANREGSTNVQQFLQQEAQEQSAFQQAQDRALKRAEMRRDAMAEEGDEG
jgi:hypothetical protein